jgi:hypothetical protein
MLAGAAETTAGSSCVAGSGCLSDSIVPAAIGIDERFWLCLQETDNDTHFKSKENLLFWSERPSKYKEFIKMVWVEYGCREHGKGPWDGLGVMSKTKVTRDLMKDFVTFVIVCSRLNESCFGLTTSLYRCTLN